MTREEIRAYEKKIHAKLASDLKRLPGFKPEADEDESQPQNEAEARMRKKIVHLKKGKQRGRLRKQGNLANRLMRSLHRLHQAKGM